MHVFVLLWLHASNSNNLEGLNGLKFHDPAIKEKEQPLQVIVSSANTEKQCESSVEGGKNTQINGSTQRWAISIPLRKSCSLRITFKGKFHTSQCRHGTVRLLYPYQHLCGLHSSAQAKRKHAWEFSVFS